MIEVSLKFWVPNSDAETLAEALDVIADHLSDCGYTVGRSDEANHQGAERPVAYVIERVKE